MSFVAENHTMDFVYLLKESFKEFPEFVLFMKLFVVTNIEIPKNTLECIAKHQSRPCSYKSIRGRLPIKFTVWRVIAPPHPASLSRSMPKNKRIFWLVISKRMSAFSLWVYNLVWPTIILTNASSENNSRSLTGVNISSSLLNFGMFCPIYNINIMIFPLHI